jgi:hypothetical protein
MSADCDRCTTAPDQRGKLVRRKIASSLPFLIALDALHGLSGRMCQRTAIVKMRLSKASTRLARRLALPVRPGAPVDVGEGDVRHLEPPKRGMTGGDLLPVCRLRRGPFGGQIFGDEPSQRSATVGAARPALISPSGRRRDDWRLSSTASIRAPVFQSGAADGEPALMSDPVQKLSTGPAPPEGRECQL